MNILYKCLLITAVVACTQVAFAQKFGYVNSQELMTKIPEIKEATAELETVRTQYEKQSQDKISSFQTKYQNLQRKQAQGEISPKEFEVEAQALRDEEMKLAKFQKEIETKLYQKSESLMAPIREKVQTIIDEVAKEKGFDYVFDASTGLLLYAEDSTNLGPEVMKRLGVE